MIDRSPNQELITLLNHAKQNLGFEVRLVTGGFDSGTWRYDKEKLLRTNLDKEILANVGGKKTITKETYTNVAAIIDDDSEEFYIRDVLTGNPSARHFAPLNTQELSGFLTRFKPPEPRIKE